MQTNDAPREMHRMQDKPACYGSHEWEWRGRWYIGCTQDEEGLALTPGCAGCPHLLKGVREITNPFASALNNPIASPRGV